MPRREKEAILGAILEAVDEVHSAGRGVSSVATKANLPYDRMSAYLEQLERSGLVTRAGPPALTMRGREALHSFRQWQQTAQRFGLK